MVGEDRMARLESDVGELKGDVRGLNVRVSELIVTTTKEFGSLRTEMEKGFGTLRTEIETNRADTEKGLGSLRTEIEKTRTEIEKTRTEIERSRADMERGVGSLKTSIESAKLWMLVTGVGSVILVTFVTFVGRVLKFL